MNAHEKIEFGADAYMRSLKNEERKNIIVKLKKDSN
jgi:hypothetical protein